MYRSDLDALLSMLNETGKAWVVQLASPESEKLSPQAAWQAHLVFVQGRVVECMIQRSLDKHSLSTGAQALEWLARAGQLAWNVEQIMPQHRVRPALAAPGGSPTSPRSVPQRTGHVEATVMKTWSHKQRQVFGLVDGTRSPEQIAALLNQPRSVVEEVLNSLQALGVIYHWGPDMFSPQLPR
jgi:hypothetical protein